jgi:transposase-like protein
MTSETLQLWLKQADLDKGKRHDRLTSDEQEELRQLPRENRILREERESLKKAPAHLPLGGPTRPIRHQVRYFLTSLPAHTRPAASPVAPRRH